MPAAPPPTPTSGNPTALKIGRRIIHAPGSVSLSEKFCNDICGMTLEKRRLTLPAGSSLDISWTVNRYAEDCCTDRISTACCSRTLATTIKCDLFGSGDCSCVGSATIDLVWDSANSWWQGTASASGCSSSTLTVRFYCDTDNAWKLYVMCANNFSSSSQTLTAFSSQNCSTYSLRESFVTSAPFQPCCTTGTMTFTVYDPSMSDASTTPGIQVTYRRVWLPVGWTVGQEFCTTAGDTCCEALGPCDCEDESANPVKKQPSILYLGFFGTNPHCSYLDGFTIRLDVVTDGGNPDYCDYNSSDCIQIDGASTYLGQAYVNYNGIIGGYEPVTISVVCYRATDCSTWPVAATLSFDLQLISCEPFYAFANVTINLPQVTSDCASAANLCTSVNVMVALFE